MKETYCLHTAAESSVIERHHVPVDVAITCKLGFVVLAKRALAWVSYLLSQYRSNYRHDRFQKPPHRKSHKLLISRNNTFFSQLILVERLVKIVC